MGGSGAYGLLCIPGSVISPACAGIFEAIELHGMVKKEEEKKRQNDERTAAGKARAQNAAQQHQCHLSRRLRRFLVMRWRGGAFFSKKGKWLSVVRAHPLSCPLQAG